MNIDAIKEGLFQLHIVVESAKRNGVTPKSLADKNLADYITQIQHGVDELRGIMGADTLSDKESKVILDAFLKETLTINDAYTAMLVIIETNSMGLVGDVGLDVDFTVAYLNELMIVVAPKIRSVFDDMLSEFSKKDEPVGLIDTDETPKLMS